MEVNLWDLCKMVNPLLRLTVSLVQDRRKMQTFGCLSACILGVAAFKYFEDMVFWKLVRKEIEEEEEILHQLTETTVKTVVEGKKKDKK